MSSRRDISSTKRRKVSIGTRWRDEVNRTLGKYLARYTGKLIGQAIQKFVELGSKLDSRIVRRLRLRQSASVHNGSQRLVELYMTRRRSRVAIGSHDAVGALCPTLLPVVSSDDTPLC